MPDDLLKMLENETKNDKSAMQLKYYELGFYALKRLSLCVDLLEQLPQNFLKNYHKIRNVTNDNRILKYKANLLTQHPSVKINRITSQITQQNETSCVVCAFVDDTFHFYLWVCVFCFDKTTNTQKNKTKQNKIKRKNRERNNETTIYAEFIEILEWQHK